MKFVEMKCFVHYHNHVVDLLADVVVVVDIEDMVELIDN
jgi:hypothetical protein